MEGRPVAAHAVAIQRAEREPEIVRRAHGVELAAVVFVHGARPFDCQVSRTCCAAGRAPARGHAGRCRACRPLRAPAGATLGGADEVFKAGSYRMPKPGEP